jgi:succinate-acetate transporter protein
LINLIVGLFELLVGNTFAYTIFGSLGGYFMSMGALLTPAFGIQAAYAKHPPEFRNAMGLFNLCWAAMFLLFLIVAIRSNIFMVVIFACVCVTCVISAIGDFQAAVGHAQAKKNLDRVCATDYVF